MRATADLTGIYRTLFKRFGPQQWWPGDSPFEVMAGAILTQNTNWNNVAKVMERLKAEGRLTAQALTAAPEAELAGLLRPSGYYNLKARRLKNFLDFLALHFENSMARLAAADLASLRPALLSIKGVGPETADSILLYALAKPTFVVDAYTCRILSRHGLIAEGCTYEELRQLFMEHLPGQVPLYQEYHALLVRLGKEWCRPQPRCASCPVDGWPAE